MDNDKAKAILQSIGLGVVVIDEQGIITEANKKFEEMLGWNREEAIGQRFTNLIKKEDQNGKLVTEEEKNPRQYFYTRKDKTRFPVCTTTTQVEGDDKSVVKTITDVTQKYDIDRTKTDFVALASHQIRTPLTIIKWYAEMIIDEDGGTLTIPQKQYIKKIFDAHERVSNLINLFSDISQTQVQEQELEYKYLDMLSMIEDLKKGFQENITAKSLELEILIPPSHENILSDPKTIETVIHNLLDNSIRYSPKGSKVTLKFFTVKKAKNNRHLVIQVHDNGLGIPTHQQKEVFTKLFRGDNTKKLNPSGSGLSLYIIKILIDRIGGEIYFESQEGKGAMFHVTIPMQDLKHTKST